jgi:methyltransferase (TIGR00027 family)
MTARGVALARSFLDRPLWPSGDAEAEERLASELAAGYERRNAREGGRNIFGWITERTKFFDAAVVRALESGVRQIVLLGAGYDGRPLRYRTPGVRFFEVDHPATQADKRARLADVDASTEGIAFVAADFTEPGLADALTAAQFDSSQRAFFMCEGVLRYLPESAFRELLRVTAAISAPSSELAASVSTRDTDQTDEERSREDRLAAAGEAVLTVPPREVALGWIADAGWSVDEVDGIAGRGRLLVHARR